MTGHELDRIKRRARAQAARADGGARSPFFRTRSALSTVAASLALVVGLTGAFAIAGKGPPSPFPGGGSSGDSAATSQYRPGKGCGDKNHIHAREDECKKPPK
jgi:hypothetical protein